MRTTLDIDADILGIAKELAHQQKTSAGKVLSNLARQALKPRKAPKFRNGIMLLERRPGSPPVTMELVNRLRDEE
jgi:hypothetical protein